MSHNITNTEQSPQTKNQATPILSQSKETNALTVLTIAPGQTTAIARSPVLLTEQTQGHIFHFSTTLPPLSSLSAAHIIPEFLLPESIQPSIALQNFKTDFLNPLLPSPPPRSIETFTHAPTLSTPLSATITDIATPPIHLTASEPETLINPDKNLPRPEDLQHIIKQLQDSYKKPLILQNSASTSSATIVGFIEGHPVAAIPHYSALSADPFLALFVLQTTQNALPVGTQIVVTPQSGGLTTQTLSTFPTLSIPALGHPLPYSYMTPDSWPVLEQIYQTLQLNAPQAALAMSNATPKAASPAQFGTAAMFFIAAVHSGDLTSWLGDKTADLLRRSGKGNLLDRLGQEGKLLGRIGAEPLTQDWRGMAIPLNWHNEIHKIILYYRQDDTDQDQDQSKTKQTRFLFDLKLDKMGPVQLDGLFSNPETKAARLDLILRAETHFSQPMQMDMRSAYAHALKETQVTGELSFQNNPDQWVHINAEEDSFSREI